MDNSRLVHNRKGHNPFKVKFSYVLKSTNYTLIGKLEGFSLFFFAAALKKWQNMFVLAISCFVFNVWFKFCC